MRIEPTDNYVDFTLLGNNSYDIIFMNYLFLSQNVNSYYCDKFMIEDKEKENGYKILAPKLSNVKTIDNGFIILKMTQVTILS